MLHPRVLQILSPDVVDSTLDTVITLCDEDIQYAAYQYPEYLVEARKYRKKRVLTPSDYSIDVLDALRDLRANDVLTSIRHRGQSPRNIASLEKMVQSMEQQGNPVEGVATLWIADDGDTPEHPVVMIEDRGDMTGRRSSDELLDVCETVKRRFFAPFSIKIASEYMSGRD